MMKLQYKYGFVMFFLGAGLLFAAMVFFYQQVRSSTLEQAEMKIREVTAEIEKRFTSSLENQSNIARTIALEFSSKKKQFLQKKTKNYTFNIKTLSIFCG